MPQNNAASNRSNAAVVWLKRQLIWHEMSQFIYTAEVIFADIFNSESYYYLRVKNKTAIAVTYCYKADKARIA